MKKIYLITILLVIAAGIAVSLGNMKNSESGPSFSARGYVTDRDPAKVNQELYLVYDEPGAPAQDRKLAFDEESVCRAGGAEEPCIAINVTIARAYGGKRVFVEGIDRGGEVLVRNLALDIDSERRFGFIRSVEKNGNNFLVTIDPVEFLSGEAAIEAGIEDTDCGREDIAECIPSLNNDFYIRNISTSTEAYNLLSEADIAIFDDPGSPVLVPATAEEFAREFQDPGSYMGSYPWRYILDGATIVLLEEQYTP